MGLNRLQTLRSRPIKPKVRRCYAHEKWVYQYYIVYLSLSDWMADSIPQPAWDSNTLTFQCNITLFKRFYESRCHLKTLRPHCSNTGCEELCSYLFTFTHTALMLGRLVRAAGGGQGCYATIKTIDFQELFHVRLIQIMTFIPPH